MNVTEIFLIALVAIFSIPYLTWRLGKTDYFAPLVVVQILTGILLGPGILGAFLPDVYNFVFNKPVIGALNGIAWWGVSLFVFFAGVELDLSKLQKNKVESGVTALVSCRHKLIVGTV